MLSAGLFGLFLTTTLLVAKLQEASIGKLKKEDDERYYSTELISRLDALYSFARIVDSKFIGLFNFLFSNLFTGLVNLSINTLHVSDSIAFFIVSLYSLTSFVIPLAIYRSMNNL